MHLRIVLQPSAGYSNSQHFDTDGFIYGINPTQIDMITLYTPTPMDVLTDNFPTLLDALTGIP